MTLRHSIGRDELLDIVERAIRRAKHDGLPDDDAHRIREACRSARRIAFGENVVRRCGCPMVKARLHSRYGEWTPPRNAFARSYDSAMWDRFPDTGGEGVVEVVE